MIGSDRMNSISAAVACARTKDDFGVLTEEEDQFWNETVVAYADAKAGGYSLEIPSDWPDMSNVTFYKDPHYWGTE